MSKPRTTTPAGINMLAFPKLPPRRRRLKITREHSRRFENVVEAMINFLNEVDDVEAEGGDDDHPINDEERERGDNGRDPDDEPSLGAGAGMNQERAWSLRENPTTDDCEEQNEDGEEREISELEHYGEADDSEEARS
jgi:Asp-tRNA(Asn)/Glu-tRNA(Gln) amidotransferase C subunit